MQKRKPKHHDNDNSGDSKLFFMSFITVKIIKSDKLSIKRVSRLRRVIYIGPFSWPKYKLELGKKCGSRRVGVGLHGPYLDTESATLGGPYRVLLTCGTGTV